MPVEPLNNPNDPAHDKAQGSTPLQPLGAGKKPLGKLEPILSVPKPLRDPKLKPQNDTFACQRVAIFAREQLADACTVPFRTIEAKKVTDNTYRVNWLADDNTPPKFGAGQVPAGAAKHGILIVTSKRVHSEMVRIVWGKTLILTRMIDDSPKRAISALNGDEDRNRTTHNP